MDRYHLWFDARGDVAGETLSDSLHAYLGHLRSRGVVESFVVERRKLGLGPADLGEWHVAMEVKGLGQLDEAFRLVVGRDAETEHLHAAVWSRVRGLKTALYRDFPDAP